MSYPGQWLQLDNFEARGLRINYDTDSQAAAAVIPHGDRDVDPLTAMTRYLSDLVSMPCVGELTATSNAQFTATLGPRTAPPALPYGRARKDLGAQRIGPQSLTPPSSIIPAAPADAVGYEWQAPDGTVVASRLEVVDLQATGSADGNPAGSAGDWTMELGIAADSGSVPTDYIGAPLTLQPTGALTQWRQDNNPALNGSADISGYVGADGRFQIMGDGQATVTAFNDDPFVETAWGTSLGPRVRTDNAANANTVRVYYTVRPPLFRWLYTTPQTPPVLPPLRQFPRRDGMGASSARRHYPPDRSVQASNRHRGGYF